MNAASLPPVVMAGISLYVGCYHFLNYLRGLRHREELAFSVLCVGFALYAVFCAGLYSAASVAAGALWQRAQFMALPVFVTAFVWFAGDYAREKTGAAKYALSAFFLIALAVQAVDRSGLTWLLDHPSVKEVTLPFGVSLTYREVEFGPFTTVQSLMGVVAGVYIVWIALRRLRLGHPREAYPLIVATGFMFAASINDTAVANRWYSFVYLIEYGYMAMILLMTASLSRVVVEAALTRDALRESEERFRSLVETTSDWVWQVDDKGRYTYASPKARDLLGYEPEELLGKTPFDLMSPEEAEHTRRSFHEIMDSRRPFERMENRNLHKDGRLLVLETSGVPVFGENGRLVGYRGIDRDITEHKKSEEERARLQGQLQQAAKMEAIGRLAGGVAHDFNNLLTAIIGNTELARSGTHSPEALTRFLEEIDVAARSAASLTRQLLAFARRQLIQPKVIDLDGLIGGLRQMLSRIVGEDIEVEHVLNPKTGNVRIDPGQLEQVIVNLAANARDAMPDGGRLLVETRNVDLDEEYCACHLPAQPGPYVRLGVSDTGHGMSEETKGHLFEPFFTTKPVGGGTGLGLATVFGIVRQADGIIEVYSEPGRGTQFKIYLPRVEEKPAEAPASRREGSLQTGGETILSVEDNESVRKWSVQALQHLGYNVLSPSTVAEVVTLVKNYPGRIDLLMTDVVMPGTTGPELASRLLALHPEMKVLFTSGYTQNVIARHGVVDDSLNFIAKPYSLRALAGKIREVLDR